MYGLSTVLLVCYHPKIKKFASRYFPFCSAPPKPSLSPSLKIWKFWNLRAVVEKMREEDIEKLRGVVRDCVSKHLYSSAIFFADKVAAFTSDPADIYMQAQALFLGRHYRRAFHLLNASQIVLRDLRFRYLAAKCLVRLIFLPKLLYWFFSVLCLIW